MDLETKNIVEKHKKSVYIDKNWLPQCSDLKD